jgi:cytochrome c biogenesis protein CcmG/thiol:disulfide interchange protein DsbE
VNSSVQIALGSSGVPETFIVDGKGIIRRQHIGAINPEDVPGLMSALAAAK